MSEETGAPGRRELWLDGAWRRCRCGRARRCGRVRIAGPALITEDTATIVLEPGFVAELGGRAA
jgi:N-methylhydantoinase A/oxoprolinase/acetone carboxylase beta subunit